MTERDHLAPMALSLWMEGGSAPGATTEGTVVALVEGVAGACEAAGASVIGHIKGRGAMGGRSFRCNLTSVRTGADFAWSGSGAADSVSGDSCDAAEGHAGHAGDAAGVAAAGDIELTLVVLVYGLEGSVVDGAVRGVIDDLASRGAGRWIIDALGCGHEHDGED